MRLCLFSGRRFEETFDNSQWRKVKQMQQMRLCLFSGRRFEETFENSQRRKVKQMQRMWQPYTSRLRLMSGPCRHSMCAASGAHAAPVHIPVRCLCQTTVWSISPRHSMLSCLATVWSISPRHYAIMPCHNTHFTYVGGATSTSSPSTSTASSLSDSTVIRNCQRHASKDG